MCLSWPVIKKRNFKNIPVYVSRPLLFTEMHKHTTIFWRGLSSSDDQGSLGPAILAAGPGEGGKQSWSFISDLFTVGSVPYWLCAGNRNKK